jgi:sulfate adenylyltransferase
MEVTDGIFVQPITGWKKEDDFSHEAVVFAYKKMCELFYPQQRCVLGVLKTPMRYAGPREAVFHALIRRNFGCTHFIVGRDHAGVGTYYGTYEAHALCRQFNDLGIEILYLHEPYYCKKCQSIVTEKTCSHGEQFSVRIWGTAIREMLSAGCYPPEEMMRKEIADILIGLRNNHTLFCGGARNI